MQSQSDSELIALLGGAEDRPIHRLVNIILSTLIGILVIATIFSGFFIPSFPPPFSHLYFSLCVILLFLGELVLVYWYRSGVLPERFRFFIYYQAAIVFLFCLGAIFFFIETPRGIEPPAPKPLSTTTTALKP